jgi:hypothetical protein
MFILQYKEEMNCNRDIMDTAHQRTEDDFIVIEDYINAYI